MLSPLSWWNDLWVNVPLALAFAWVVSLFYKPAFVACCVVGYWLTNVLGFVLMHKGAQKMFSTKKRRAIRRRDLLRDVGISLLYTVLIVALVKFGILKPLENYFPIREHIKAREHSLAVSERLTASKKPAGFPCPTLLRRRMSARRWTGGCPTLRTRRAPLSSPARLWRGPRPPRS